MCFGFNRSHDIRVRFCQLAIADIKFASMYSPMHSGNKVDSLYLIFSFSPMLMSISIFQLNKINSLRFFFFFFR